MINAVLLLKFPPVIRAKYFLQLFLGRWIHKIDTQQRQFFIPTISNKELNPAQLKHCQEFCGFSNYLTQVIENTTKTAVSAIASYFSTISWKDLKFQINPFLGYAAYHPLSKIRYLSIQMHSWIHPDKSYLNEYEAFSRNGDCFHLLEKPKLPTKPNYPSPKINALVIVNSKIINTDMSSVQ